MRGVRVSGDEQVSGEASPVRHLCRLGDYTVAGDWLGRARQVFCREAASVGVPECSPAVRQLMLSWFSLIFPTHLHATLHLGVLRAGWPEGGGAGLSDGVA